MRTHHKVTFYIVCLHTSFISNCSTKLVLTLLHVSATYFSHPQGAIIL
jgi:hypothetical protein